MFLLLILKFQRHSAIVLTDPADVTQTVGQKLWIFGGIEGTSPLINEDTSLKTWELADDENSWIRVGEHFLIFLKKIKLVSRK